VLIAQISDIHARPRADWRTPLDEAIARINAAGADAVIISGDLCNQTSDPGYPDVVLALEKLRCPIYPVPGNVDDRDAMRAAFAGTAPLPDQGPLTYEAEIGGALRVLALDVMIPGEIGGELRPETARWLAERLPASDLPTIIMMHQQPFRRGTEFDTIMCAGSDALERLLLAGQGNVAAVVCGHGHQAMTLRWGGTLALMSPAIRGGKPARSNPPGFVWHDFRSGELVSHFEFLV
jgi:3',5'-cyclic AMP phosphodiesterase CpdA